MSTLIEQIASIHIAILVLCVVIFNAVFFIMWDLFRKRDIFKFSREIKGYNFYPIIGNGYHVIGKNAFIAIQKVVGEFNLPCNLWLGHEYNYVTANAAEIKVILNHSNTFNKGSVYDNFKIAFADTLLLAQFVKWKVNRKIFARSFSQPILNSFVDIFYEKSCTLVSILNESHARDKFEIFERLSLDSFCANIMRLDLDHQVNINDELTHIMQRLQKTVGRRITSSYFYPDFLWLLSPKGRRFLKDLHRMKEIIFEIIQKKRRQFQGSTEFKKDGQKLPLMDMMLEDGTTFSDKEIFQEIVLFLLAATDTSGSTLAFTFTLLGMNPEAQEKVYQEVTHHIGVSNHIQYKDLANLKYTERAIQESMRLLPVTPLLARQATAEVDLGSRKIPGGSNILINVFDLHRSKSYWENPLKYDPDRFLPEEVAKRDPYCYIPFSAGPRNCIGKTYAMMMMKVTVAQVIRNFEVRSKYKSVEEMEFESCITMKTTHVLDCQFIPRIH